MGMHSQIWPVMMVVAGLAFAGATQATQSKDSTEPDARSHTGMVDLQSVTQMKGMMSMMDGCAGMMQMPGQLQGAPNQQWRQNRSVQPESR